MFCQLDSCSDYNIVSRFHSRCRLQCIITIQGTEYYYRAVIDLQLPRLFQKNFTDGSQRAGHIAVGEMYLSLYLFPNKHLFYLWPKMTKDEVNYLDRTKAGDKEWSLLSGEDRVTIVTRDNIRNLPMDIVRDLEEVSHLPGKGEALKTYNRCIKFIVSGLRDGSLSIF